MKRRDKQAPPRPDLTCGDEPRVSICWVDIGWPIAPWSITVSHGMLSWGAASAYTVRGAQRKGARLLAAFLRREERKRVALERLAESHDSETGVDRG